MHLLQHDERGIRWSFRWSRLDGVRPCGRRHWEGRRRLGFAGPVRAEVAFEIELRDRDRAGECEVDDAGSSEYREEFEVLANDLLRSKRQFVDENDGGDRGA